MPQAVIALQGKTIQVVPRELPIVATSLLLQMPSRLIVIQTIIDDQLIPFTVPDLTHSLLHMLRWRHLPLYKGQTLGARTSEPPELGWRF